MLKLVARQHVGINSECVQVAPQGAFRKQKITFTVNQLEDEESGLA